MCECKCKCENPSSNDDLRLVNKFWDQNGKLQEHCKWVNEKPSSNDDLRLVETFWDNDPTRPDERYYTDEHGKRHGLYQRWGSNGKLRERYEYVNGKFHGLQEGWYENGQLWFRTNWVNDKRHGFYEYWHNNGKHDQQVQFDNDVVVIDIRIDRTKSKAVIHILKIDHPSAGELLIKTIKELQSTGLKVKIAYE